MVNEFTYISRLKNKMLERISEFSYLGYKESFIDIPDKILKYTKTLGIINIILKPSLVQRNNVTPKQEIGKTYIMVVMHGQGEKKITE